MNKKDRPNNMYRQSFQYIRNSCAGVFILTTILILLNSFVAPLRTYVLQLTIQATEDYIRGNRAVSMLVLLYSILFASMALFPFLDHVISILSKKMTYRVKASYQTKLSGKLDHIQYYYFEDTNFYNRLSRIQDQHQSVIDTAMTPISILSRVFSLIGYVLIVVQIQWLILPILTLFLVPNIIIDIKKADRSYQLNVEISEKNRYQNYLYSLFFNQKMMGEFRLFNFIPYLQKRWNETTNFTYDRRLHVLKKNIEINFVSMILHSSGIFVSVLVLILTSKSKQASLASFMAVYSAVESILILVAYRLSHILKELRTYWHFWNDYNAFLEVPEDSYENSGQSEVSLHEVSLEFHDVYFQYPNMDSPVLQGVSFQIKPGTTCAIVGKNGSGKSTIIKLLLRLYEPDSGFITINGKRLTEYSVKQLHDMVSVTFQDFIKYPMTVRENVGFGSIEHINDDARIKEALSEISNVDTYRLLSSDLEKQLSTEYLDGIDLSEGQWQQLAIARTTFREAPVMILDEPTASLDANTESDLYTSFSNIVKGNTCLLISHRLGSAKICDEILVLDKGKIAEKGTHEELMKNEQLYYQMYTTQMEQYYKNERYRVSSSVE